MNENKFYDTVIIGSSPALLILAYKLGQSGESVLVCEKNQTLGGCWQTIDLGTYKNIDMGPHHYTYNKKALDFFAKEISEIYMQKVYIYNYDLSLHKFYSHKYGKLRNNLISFRKNIKKSIKGWIIFFVNCFQSLTKFMSSFFKPDAFYDFHGSEKLMSAILDKVSDCGNTRILYTQKRQV